MNTNTLDVAAPKKLRYLSHFTPSMMPPETLQQMLVQRGPLLDRCVKEVTDNVMTEARHHYLFVGPRGIGKTHLISLIHHRLEQEESIRQHALLAWMREEEWGVTSFFELVLRILRTLSQEHPSLNISDKLKPLYDMPIKDAEQMASSILLECIAAKTLIVFFENLDDLFSQLGEIGQRQLRAFIQNHPRFVLIATAPSIFNGVSLQKSPFYGFFDIEFLREFDFDEVVLLLEKIAVARGDSALVAFIKTADGRSRIRAVHHLAEGNPRIYVIFAQFLSREALDELVQAFMHTLDELTPYYQARMKELPGQQRKIVEYLVQYRGAATVKQIAKNCFISQQTCSSQLKQLKEKRYVRSEELGRESFYELSEPLMRLCMEVKKQRGEPIGLFVEILRIWYSIKQLMELADGCGEDFVDKQYLQTAIEKSKREKSDPKLKAQIKDFKKLSAKGDKESQARLLEEMCSTQYESKFAEMVRSMLVLSSCIKKAIAQRSAISEKKEVLALGYADYIAHVLPNLHKKEAEQMYFGITFASVGLLTLDKKLFLPTLKATVTFLSRFPALAHVAIIGVASLVSGKAEEKLFGKWITLVQEEAERQSNDKNVQRFIKAGDRMHTAFGEYIESSDEKKLMPLPLEERKLLRTRFSLVGTPDEN